MRNIIGTAADIAGLALSQASAKKCEKDLASSAGSASSDPTISAASIKDYCSDTANSSTQFCKCQSNPTATGCMSATLTGSNIPTATDKFGTDLKNAGGASAFAGGISTAGSGGAGGYNPKNGYGNDPQDPTQANLGASNTTTAGGGPTSSGSNVNGGGGGAGGNQAANGDASKGQPDDKKWSFGSFASAIGSSLGFGGGSTSSRSGGDNGGVSGGSSQEAAISRRIASDRFSAEVTPSTGTDNFAKIKRSYVQKSDTFMANP